MQIKITFLLLFLIALMCMGSHVRSQVESVPLDNQVYDFLKQMSVKRILPSINDDNPVLSKGEVAEYLKKIDAKNKELSEVEKKTLEKYKTVFIPELMNNKNTDVIIAGDGSFGKRVGDIFSKKQKYLYLYKKENFTNYTNLTGHLDFTKEFKPSSDSSVFMMDVGFRTNGTAFKHLGYGLSVSAGFVFGSAELARTVKPELSSNYKFIENIENIRNYDFADGYLKYYAEPADDMKISVQLGREKIRYGSVGYADNMMISGNANDLDFIKFDFKYGVLNFSSIHASTVGYYNVIHDSNYTKYIATNRLKLSFPDLFDIGMTDMIVYSGRFDLAYLTPLGFYKYIEMSLQDRDNGIVSFDFQSHFMKDLQFQAAFMLDENILGNFQNLSLAANKTGYQLGVMAYEPFGLKNVSLILEYTKIRPYVYSHVNRKNNFTSFGQLIGGDIGPNADRIYAKIAYNISEWVSLNFEYQHIRKGNDVYDANGNLVRKVGGDPYYPYIDGVDPKEAVFLDGDRVNTDAAIVNLRFEPFRNLIFDLVYNYTMYNYITRGNKNDINYAFLRFSIDY
ncbi:MAG: hypothetical protein NTV87_07580 [Ignavibacteriae bacterium]|nr:hypothetical protein [Ignavibacteriota bacterium]